MTVSSRTPEGLPSLCPLCGAEPDLDFSALVGDAPCPCCGYLLWKSEQTLEFVRKSLAGNYAVPLEKIRADSSFEELGNDSLEFVELLMELEDEYDLAIPDEDYSEIRTVGDLVRYLAHAESRH